MKATLVLTATLALALSAGAADAQKIDKNGKCHDTKGKFAAMSVCKASVPAAPKHCRDVKTKKFAKCGAPNSEPVPNAK